MCYILSKDKIDHIIDVFAITLYRLMLGYKYCLFVIKFSVNYDWAPSQPSLWSYSPWVIEMKFDCWMNHGNAKDI